MALKNDDDNDANSYNNIQKSSEQQRNVFMVCISSTRFLNRLQIIYTHTHNE